MNPENIINVPEAHHNKVFYILIVIVAVVLVILALVAMNVYRNKPVPKENYSTAVELEARQALLNKTLQPADLTKEEINKRQSLINKTAVSVKLSEEEIKARQELLNK